MFRNCSLQRGRLLLFKKMVSICPGVLKLLHTTVYNKPSQTFSLTAADPVSIMDVDNRAHKVTPSLPLLPEDIQSFPCMFLTRTEKFQTSLGQNRDVKKQKQKHPLSCEGGLHELNITISL